MKKKAIFIVSRNKNFKTIKNNLVLFAGKYCLSEKLEKKLKTKKIKYEFLKNYYKKISIDKSYKIEPKTIFFTCVKRN